MSNETHAQSEGERKAMSGRCLCGAITVEAASAPLSVGACHCKMCRRWGGGPGMELHCGPDVRYSDPAKISVFASSEWAERGFCSQCGSHLFYRLKESGDYLVPVGLFDDDDALRFETQVFIEERPGYYEFANETDNMTGKELFEKFGGA